MLNRTSSSTRLLAVLVVLSSCSPAPVPAPTPAPRPRVANPQAISTEERVVLDSSGWELIGVLRVPSPPEPMPVVLLLHSAASSRDESAGLAADLSARGVATLRLDLRAHGESDNLGRFREPYADHRPLLQGTYEDVVVALEWLAGDDRFATERIGVLAASYSGEALAQALRAGGPEIAACVVLSPGNFSEESVAQVAESDARWLFIRTSEESEGSLRFVDDVFARLESQPAAELRVVPGAGHAGEILREHPIVSSQIADWLRAELADR